MMRGKQRDLEEESRKPEEAKSRKCRRRKRSGRDNYQDMKQSVPEMKVDWQVSDRINQ